MTISELTSLSNSFTDESVLISNCINYANAAIAIINNEVNLILPFFEMDTNSSTVDYTALPKQWQISLIGNYINYSVKLNDSSMTEAKEYKTNFYDALSRFKEQAGGVDSTGASIISDAYKGEGFGGVYTLDTSGAIDMGWFGPRTGGGF